MKETLRITDNLAILKWGLGKTVERVAKSEILKLADTDNVSFHIKTIIEKQKNINLRQIIADQFKV